MTAVVAAVRLEAVRSNLRFDMEKLMKLGKYALGVSLAVGAAGLAFAVPQQDSQGAKQDMKDAGQETKAAAKDTGRATKKTAKKTGHAVKKGTNKAAKKTDQGAQKVEDKTQTPPQ